MIERLESIDVTPVADLAGRGQWEVMHEVNLQAGGVISRPPSVKPRPARQTRAGG